MTIHPYRGYVTVHKIPDPDEEYNREQAVRAMPSILGAIVQAAGTQIPGLCRGIIAEVGFELPEYLRQGMTVYFSNMEALDIGDVTLIGHGSIIAWEDAPE